MKRKIIHIDEDKCNGCEACASACMEGVIQIINGKAKLIRDDYCDGLGNCLPVCPTGAITFFEREALPYNEEVVKENMMKKKMQEGGVSLNAHHHHEGCPGSRAMLLNQNSSEEEILESCSKHVYKKPTSRLNQWPCQIKLVNVNVPYFENAKLLIAAIVLPLLLLIYMKNLCRAKSL